MPKTLCLLYSRPYHRVLLKSDTYKSSLLTLAVAVVFPPSPILRLNNWQKAELKEIEATKQPRNIQYPRRPSRSHKELLVLLQKHAGTEAIGHPEGAAGSHNIQPLPCV